MQPARLRWLCGRRLSLKLNRDFVPAFCNLMYTALFACYWEVQVRPVGDYCSANHLSAAMRCYYQRTRSIESHESVRK